MASDLVQMPMGVLGLVLDRTWVARKPFFFTFATDDPQPGRPSEPTAAFRASRLDARIDQGAKRHVAADTARAIEVCHSCHVLTHFLQ